jgi:DNA-binding LacI/PurR family transcriptional regulator
MSENITIKDIAKRLYISVSTVSRALQGSHRVNATTRAKVMKVARELNYQPNALALNLRKQKTNTIGIIIPGFIIQFYSSAISAIQTTMEKHGYNVIICQSNESYATELKNLQTLTSYRVDGIIASVSKETSNVDHFRQLIHLGVPLVFFNRTLPELNASTITIDDFDGAKKAVHHLATNGSKRIAIIMGPKNLHIYENRLKGYCSGLKANNLKLDNDLIKITDLSVESIIDAVENLMALKNPPDAIFTANDDSTFLTLALLKEKGVKIPDDVALVGYTSEPKAEYVTPAITTVERPTAAIGKLAAELLLNQLKPNKGEKTTEVKKLKANLIVRQSSVKTNLLQEH